MVSLEVSTDVSDVVIAIAERAVALYKQQRRGEVRSKAQVIIDLVVTHANGCPLRLADLLAADDFNFMHDVDGIAEYLDRDTGKLTDCFRPRFQLPNQHETEKPTEAEIQAAWRVLHNWGGLRDTNADAPSIVKTMLMAAAKVRSAATA